MDTDINEEVINGENTYEETALLLRQYKSVLIGWTDQKYLHYDILFTLNPYKEGLLLSGSRWNDLYVSIIGLSVFGFSISNEEKTDLKLKMIDNISTELSELINQIIKRLRHKEINKIDLILK